MIISPYLVLNFLIPPTLRLVLNHPNHRFNEPDENLDAEEDTPIDLIAHPSKRVSNSSTEGAGDISHPERGDHPSAQAGGHHLISHPSESSTEAEGHRLISHPSEGGNHTEAEAPSGGGNHLSTTELGGNYLTTDTDNHLSSQPPSTEARSHPISGLSEAHQITEEGGSRAAVFTECRTSSSAYPPQPPAILQGSSGAEISMDPDIQQFRDVESRNIAVGYNVNYEDTVSPHQATRTIMTPPPPPPPPPPLPHPPSPLHHDADPAPPREGTGEPGGAAAVLGPQGAVGGGDDCDDGPSCDNDGHPIARDGNGSSTFKNSKNQ